MGEPRSGRSRRRGSGAGRVSRPSCAARSRKDRRAAARAAAHGAFAALAAVGRQRVVGLAFALGLVLDQVDRTQRINILAPPVLGLLIWNVVVYVAILAGYVVRYGDVATPGPLRGAITRIAGGLSRPRRGGALGDAILAFVDDWARRSAPLYGMRAARILHIAAARLPRRDRGTLPAGTRVRIPRGLGEHVSRRVDRACDPRLRLCTGHPAHRHRSPRRRRDRRDPLAGRRKRRALGASDGRDRG